MKENSSRLDIVIFGATGYTGKHTVLKLLNFNKHVKNIKWGIAGRNKRKMEDILTDIEEKSGEDLKNIQQFIACIEDEESLMNMTSHARVIINCVGPFILYGEPIVKACLASGTHYIDSTVETYFIEKMHFQYHTEAEEKGIYIIHACCVQSIPADLGAIFLMKHFEGEVNSIESFFELQYEGAGRLAALIQGWPKGPVANFATCNSLLQSVACKKEIKLLQQRARIQQPQEIFPILEERPLIYKSDIVDGWCIPNFCSDESVMYHTQQYLGEQNSHRPAQVKSYIALRSCVGAFIIMFGLALIFLFSLAKSARTLMAKYPRLFTFGYFSNEGPTDEVERKTIFTVTLCGEGWKQTDAKQHMKPLNKKMIVKVSGMSCYEASWTPLVLCAVTVLTEKEKMPGRGGVLSPGAAFANTSLIEELEKHGLKFEIVSQKEH